MSDRSEQRRRPTPRGLEPGTLSAVLKELAAVPEDPDSVGWTGWLFPGTVVGRFEMLREIGRGGFGMVWEARDRDLGRNVAFKAIRAGPKAALCEERLLREAEAVARLSHPNLVTLYDVGRAERGPYLVMELLKGATLADRLGGGAMAAPEAVRIGVEIAKGVAHAHVHGVIHRDLKPANVLLCDDGRVKIVDFGLAHAFGRRRLDGGTPAYMAPEQWAGAPEDERSDVFAMGAILFRMLSGELPFPDDGAGKAPRFPSKPPALDVPEEPALGDLVRRMLDRDPTRRPRDGSEVLEALSEVQRSLERVTSSSSAPIRARRRTAWRPAVTVAAAVLAGVALAVVFQAPTAPWSNRDGRIVVAVADFANGTRDPDLDGLSGFLITSLEQSKKLHVLTRGRMLDLVREVGGGDGSRVDESVARAAGRQASVNALLLGSIQKLGDTYAAELRAIDPQRDEYLFTLREQVKEKNDLLPLIDRISDRTRLALRESDAEVKASAVSVAEAVTPSLEAYRHYFRGKELASRGRVTDAVAEYRRAIEIEPRFALAQVEVAWIGYFAGETRNSARASLEQAERNAVRPPDKEAGLIRILKAFFDGRFAAAGTEIRSIVTRFPDDPDVAVLAAVVLSWCGDAEGAAPLFERALKLAPEWDFLRLNQIETLVVLGRAREALALAEEAARSRATPSARVAVGIARYLVGDVNGGVAALRSSGADDDLSRAFLALGLAAQGKFGDALETAGTVRKEIVADLARAQVLAHAGRLREGLAWMDAAARRPGVDVAFNRQRTAWYLAAAGDRERARRTVSQGQFFTMLDGVMLSEIGDERRVGALLAELAPATVRGRFLRALEARRARNLPSALAELRAIDPAGGSFVPYFHGLAAFESGLHEEAVEAFGRFEGPVLCGAPGYMAPWFLARARYLKARSLYELGRRDEARTVLRLQLERWKDADADLPLLAEMKALSAKIASAAADR
jgi:tetratricopeptide (TPR) repeat protein